MISLVYDFLIKLEHKIVAIKSAHLLMPVFLCKPEECNCRGGRCDPRTGECRCPDGMTGKQCDSCLQKYSVPIEHHHEMHCERE